MSFASFHFILFFGFVLFTGYFLKNRFLKIFLLLASYFFFGIFNSWYLLLLLFSTLVDYVAALGIEANTIPENSRETPFIIKQLSVIGKKSWLVISLFLNLALLGYFKYANFAIDIINDTQQISGQALPHLNILLPIGISFYTFQSMSYTIDVYRGILTARRNLIDFALYVAFFPQLVAGPIVRATTFFPSLDNPPEIKRDDIIIGVTRIAMGFFQKLVLSDNIAPMVNQVFAGGTQLHPIDIWLGSIGWGFQIYFDFAGYSLIARGIGRLFGYEYDVNFLYPMTAKNIREHWERWHISLISWFRDYLYIPLGGSRSGSLRFHINTLTVWILTGLWHGAGYNFLFSGIWQWIMLTVFGFYSKTKICFYLNKNGGIVYDIFSRVTTIAFLVIGWIWFRSENLTTAHRMIGRLVGIFDLPYFFLTLKKYIFSGASFQNAAIALTGPVNFHYPAPRFLAYGLLIALYFIYEYLFNYIRLDYFYKKENARQLIILLTTLFFLIAFFANPVNLNFIYFQF